MKSTFHHLHFFCHDLETMTAFWQQGFGAVEAGRRTIGGMPAADLDLEGGLRLVLQVTNGILNDSICRTGYNHIGFEVQGLEDALKRLLGLPHVSLRDAPQESALYRYAFITGPEGVVVEVLERK